MKYTQRVCIGGLLLLAVGFPRTAWTLEEHRLAAGVAKRRVTPPIWVPYLTSSGQGTNAPLQGVHDDLFAKALVLDDGQHAIAVLAVDSIGYDNAILGPGRDFTVELRRRVAVKTDLKPEAILLAASHTHSAPETIGLTSFHDEARVAAWLETHLDELANTVIAAAQHRVPVRIRAGSTRVPDLARYRRIVLKDGSLNRNGPFPDPDKVAVPWKIDDELNVLYFETDAGKPYAALLNYTAHPVIAMLIPQVSADYPGAATAAVEAALPGALCLFTQGAAGNINSSRVSASFAEVEQIGTQLGRAALRVVERMKTESPLADTRITFASETLELAPRDCPPLGVARRTFEQQASPTNARLWRLAKKLDEGPIRAEVQVLAVGPLRWVALPGEPFVETGLALKQAGAKFVVGYANGYIGYLPIRRAYAEGGYEVTPGPWSRVAPGSAERLQEVAERLLRQLAMPKP